jgi:hypothetical protein
MGMTQGQGMRVSRWGAGIVAIAALLLPVTALANELLVMPYACTMVGGQPLLTPSPEQGHRVLGPRDQRRFSACSPVNPDMCRQWTVYRFDLDCDGSRVPWASVVAATNEGSRRAWLLDGRLVLRMGPRWSLPVDDPCAQEPGQERRFEYRRTRRHCADRLALAPPPVVEMPFGYAPMLGIDGIFVKAGPNVAGATPQPMPPLAAVPPTAGPPGARPAPVNPMPDLFPSEPPSWPEPFAREEPTRPAPAVPPQALPQPQPPPKIATAAPPPPGASETPRPAPAESKPAAADARPAPKAAASAPPAKTAADPPPARLPVTDAPKAAAAAVRPAASEAARPSPPASPPPKAAEPASIPTKPDVESPRPALPAAADPEGSGPSINLLGAFRTTTLGALVAFGGLTLGLISAFALARRNESMRDARRRPRDLGSVSLGDKRPRPPARIANARGSLPPNAAASAMSRMPGQAAAANGVTEWGDRMPQTRAEALQMLGIGVAPTANEAAIKKIIDGLRQSWHPDLAKDEADRVMRELRSKQINAAWDLLRSQRAVV